MWVPVLGASPSKWLQRGAQGQRRFQFDRSFLSPRLGELIIISAQWIDTIPKEMYAEIRK